MSHLQFPKFDDIIPSTNTFVILTNIDINTANVFEKLPITEYTILPKKRGRKKKDELINPNHDVPAGSIISLEKKNVFRGVNLKDKIFTEKNFFRNSITIVMVLEKNKHINFKISINGKIQMTGCKTEQQACDCINYIWKYIKDDTTNYTFKNSSDTNFEFLVVPVMRNIDFSVNFTIDRLKIDSYINTKTPYHSLLETSSGYTGVNASFPVRKDIMKTPISKYKYVNDELTCIKVPYSEYIDMLKPDEKKKKLKSLPKKINTFLIFQSGKTICSGINADIVKDSYYEFINMIRDCYSEVVEVLDEDKIK